MPPRGLLDDPERTARLIALLDAGARLREIAAELGVSCDTITRARKKLGRAAHNCHYDAARIVALRDAGKSYAEICEAEGVSVQTVWRVLLDAGKVRRNARTRGEAWSGPPDHAR